MKIDKRYKVGTNKGNIYYSMLLVVLFFKSLYRVLKICTKTLRFIGNNIVKWVIKVSRSILKY